MPTRLRTVLLLLVMMLALLPPAGWADPPAHAPAHGWRKKHDPYYLGYAGKKWPHDYGVLVGRCDYAAVGAVLGGAVGGAIGSQVGQGQGRTVAIIVGTVVGAVLGAQIGRDLDEADRACIGHTLELAPPGQRVVWVNPNTGIEYVVVPTRNFQLDDRDCREFAMERIRDGRRVMSKGQACRDATGSWQPS
ncbi:RT0821/Lpp0805 family surface protein [Thiobacter aerophilum]|uniref:RT0821/Lpp0805 family surface protein n=1 Tax=Thiobacter aerophilum TaxID=3121275 RepID=A0ABV0EBG5_9BURK